MQGFYFILIQAYTISIYGVLRRGCIRIFISLSTTFDAFEYDDTNPNHFYEQMHVNVCQRAFSIYCRYYEMATESGQYLSVSSRQDHLQPDVHWECALLRNWLAAGDRPEQ